jgi:hypothetical protein
LTEGVGYTGVDHKVSKKIPRDESDTGGGESRRKLKRPKRKRGADLCWCKPIEGDPQPHPGTILCSHCGFEALMEDPVIEAKPHFNRLRVRSQFGLTWHDDQKSAYRYWMELTKPFQKETGDAARLSYWMVQRWTKRGIIRGDAV